LLCRWVSRGGEILLYFIEAMSSIVDEVYDLLRQKLNPFLETRGLEPIRRFSLVPVPNDILPSLALIFRELGVAKEFSSPKRNVLKSNFNIFFFIREQKQTESSLMGDYIQAIFDFLEENKPERVFWGKCEKVSNLSLKSPSLRGIDIEYEVFYLA
jgi:hypothetical protein